MAYPASWLIHSATLTRRIRNYSLPYDGGTVLFTVGATLTGMTSHATAIIVAIEPVAAGNLTIRSITGTFQDNEAITDNGTGGGIAETTIRSGALPGAGVNLLITAITPTRTFGWLDFQFCPSNAGELSAVITLDGVTTVQKLFSGATLEADIMHHAQILVPSGASVNFRYTGTAGGTFDMYVIVDNGSAGAAVVNGTVTDAVDSHKEITFTEISSTVACRFMTPTESIGMNGARIISTPKVILPAGTVFAEGDLLTGTDAEFARTYMIGPRRTINEPVTKTISHYSCDIAAVM